MEWKIYDHIYSISENGDVRNDRTLKILSPEIHYKGYLRVTLHKKRKFIHRLVAILYVSNPDNKPQVNHLDGIKANNHYTNLAWCTNSENNLHAYTIGLKSYGETNRKAKLTNIAVEEIKHSRGLIPAKDLSSKYKVKPITIYKIWSGENRKVL